MSQNIARYREWKVLWYALVIFYQGHINIEKMDMPLREKIRPHFQACIFPSCVRRVCVIHKSTDFHNMRIECQRKTVLINFLLHYLFQPLPDPLRPNFVAHQSLAPKSLATWYLSPQQSLPDRSFPVINRSPIACLLPPTRYLVFCFPNLYLIAWSLFLCFSKNNPKESRWL